MARPALRLIAVGCGRVFERYHLPALRAAPDVMLVAVCESDPARRTAIAALLPGVACVESLDALPSAAQIDAALLCTPPHTHGDLGERLLRHGLHVLVEKPMALTRGEAQRLLAAARGAGRLLRVGFNRRYRAGYERARRRALADGPIRQVAFTFIADVRRWNPDAQASATFVLHDAGSHAVDLVAHVAGTPLEAVRASQVDAAGCAVQIEARLRGGAEARCLVGQSPRYREELRIVTPRSTLHVDASGQTSVAWLALRAQLAYRRITARPTPTDESFRGQLAGFAAACRGEPDDIGADARAGAAAVAAIDAAMSSLADGGAWRDVPTDGSDDE